MSSKIYNDIDLDEAYNNRHRQCPDCNSQTIQRTADCLTKAGKADTDIVDITVPGVYCTNCGWFELDKEKQDKREDIRRTAIDTDSEESNKKQKNVPIRFTNKDNIEVDEKNIDQISENRILIEYNDSCPSCNDTILIEATAERNNKENVYTVVREICINYSISESGCDHKLL